MDTTPYTNKFRFYCQKILPLVYDNSLSYYEVLCKLGEYMAELSKSQDAVWDFVQGIDDVSKEWPAFKDSVQEILDGYQQEYQGDINNFENQFNEFKNNINSDQSDFIKEVQNEMKIMSDTIEAIKNGAYLDLYLHAIKEYIDTNVQKFVANIVTYVSFGLSADGHFVAYIPENWKFVKFSTIDEPTSPLYKHLVLSW